MDNDDDLIDSVELTSTSHYVTSESKVKSFLNNDKNITGVNDVLDRMRNADKSNQTLISFLLKFLLIDLFFL